MSNVNTNTSWSSFTDGDIAYNTVLGCSGYDTDGVRLFTSAQVAPEAAKNVSTEYARGFTLSSGYDGLLRHYAASSESADLKTVTFTMGTEGLGYDLTDATCYVQFRNIYSVSIDTWSLQHKASDGTLTTLASGSTLASGDEIQVDFTNDYGDGQFLFTITYSGVVVYDRLYLSGSNDPVARSGSAFGNYSGYHTSNISSPGVYSTVPTQSDDIQIYLCVVSGTARAFVKGNLPANNICTAWRNWSGYGIQYWYQTSYSTYSGIRCYNITVHPAIPDLINWLTTNGYVHDSLEDAADALNSGVSGGVDTSDLDEYEGGMWQCRFLANISNISPGPMATESIGGTEGDFDNSTDIIATPALPTTYYPTGCHMYLIDGATLQMFHDIVYNSSFLGSIFSDFRDRSNGIVSIMQYPFAQSSIPISTQTHIYIGSDEVADTSGVPVIYPLANPASRYTSVSCGTVDLHLYWDSALDLNPYTKLSCYIPGVGKVPLDPDIVMGHTLGLVYNVDLMTGAAAAILTIDGDYLDEYSCNLATQYAINGEQYAGLYRGLVTTAATAALGFATAGSGAAIAGTLTGAASSLMSQKINRDRAGNMGASQVLLSQLQPFIEILRPIQQLPRNYTKYNAYPSYMTTQLVNLSGYAEVQDVFLDDIECTDDERQELADLLRGGVIFG